MARPGTSVLNERNWNTADLDVVLDSEEMKEMIDHSYQLIVAGLTKRARAEHRLDAAAGGKS
jgi:predicted DNA-binding protein (MmcQ/YjbR family)